MSDFNYLHVYLSILTAFEDGLSICVKMANPRFYPQI